MTAGRAASMITGAGSLPRPERVAKPARPPRRARSTAMTALPAGEVGRRPWPFLDLTSAEAEWMTHAGGRSEVGNAHPSKAGAGVSQRKEAAAMVDAREAPKGPEASASRREEPRTSPAGATEQLVLTLSAATGEIVKVEKLDGTGKRHELSEEEY